MQGDRSEQTTANQRALARAQLERLESDLHVLSPVGIERAAWGWDRHDTSLERFHTSERAALHAVETSNESEDWDAWRRRLFQDVEGRQALIGWHTEHQMHAPHVHKAEQAAFGAAHLTNPIGPSSDERNSSAPAGQCSDQGQAQTRGSSGDGGPEATPSRL